MAVIKRACMALKGVGFGVAIHAGLVSARSTGLIQVKALGESAHNLVDGGRPLTLIYDGGCPFCRHFALRSALAAGLPELRIVDGREQHQLRHQLRQRGLDLTDGAVLLEGGQAWHGSAAIAELSGRMQASEPLLQVLQLLFRDRQRARWLYPGLLLARRWALGLQGLSPNPDAEHASGS